MTYGDDVWIDTLSAALEAAVVRATDVPRDKVFLSLVEPQELGANPPGTTFITLSPERLPVDSGIVTGAGLLHTAFDSVWLVTIYTRIGTDVQFKDTNLIRDGSRGMAKLVRRLCGGSPPTVRGLQLNPLLDDSGNSLLREPMRLTAEGIKFNMRRPPSGWATATTHWSVKFRTDLTQG